MCTSVLACAVCVACVRDSRAGAGRKAFVLHPSATLDEGAGWFVVDGGECADVADELVQQRGLDQVRLLRDQRLLSQNHLLRRHRVSGQQAPVDVPAVTQVRVIRVLTEQTQS